MLTEKWRRETEYRLIKDLWAFSGNRIAVRFQYECLTDGQWYRGHGNEQWEFAENAFATPDDCPALVRLLSIKGSLS